MPQKIFAFCCMWKSSLVLDVLLLNRLEAGPGGLDPSRAVGKVTPKPDCSLGRTALSLELFDALFLTCCFCIGLGLDGGA